MPLSTGDKLGPYEILSAIGSGGMGEVWKARDSRLDRIVAIKTSREVFSERFEREARAIAALNHPHICQIFDVGPDYLVMEYIEGQEIKGPMTVHQALRSAVQLAGALEAAHRKSITHRDLKPANILNTKTGVKVLDFGLAKFVAPKAPLGDETVTRALTEEGTIVGTLQYMSPEQLQGKPADARSDIFSFGCVLYEILTGNRAFRAENKATLVAAIIDREPEPLTAIQPPLQQTPPPMLDRIMRKCLAKDPDDRWQSAADLKSQLEWLLESGSNAGIPQPALEEPHRNHSLGWILTTVFFAVSLIAFAVFHFRTAPAPAPVVRFEIPPPEGTSWAGGDFPVVSPDGSRVVFPAMKRDGTTGLWMRPLNSLTSQPISGTVSGTDHSIPTWSPDGRSIAYVADSKLYTLDLSGGAPQMIASAALDLKPTWTPAGMLLFRTAAVARFPPLMQVSASGGDAKPVVNSGLYFVNPIPGGQKYVYTKLGSKDLFSGTLDSKDEKRLTSGSLGFFVPPHRLLYVRGSALVAQAFDPGSQSLSGDPVPVAEPVGGSSGRLGLFSASQSVLAYRTVTPRPSVELAWYGRQGQRLGAVGEAGYYTNPALSPDGKRLAVSRLTDTTTGNRDIWVWDLTRGVSTRFTFGPDINNNPVWSPDGSRLAFIRYAKDSSLIRSLYAKPAGGGASEELLFDDKADNSAEDWSPDGKLLLFNVGAHEIDALPMTGDRKPYPVLKAAFSQTNAAVSPDGRWIAYLSDESGTNEIFVQSFPPSGGKWQISTNVGTEPSWRRDGKELYFMSGTKLMAVDVKAAGSAFEAGIPKVLFEAPVRLYNGDRNRYVPAPDGQRFLFITTPVALDTTPFVVVENWQNSVKLK